ncbi:MAG: YqgE/AlgH family protein [Pseudomonadota bacterium]|nr:YqgE/AlgH family protein [Pseudomonadota bacterium]
MDKKNSYSLAGHLLLSMPSMSDPNFDNSVTYICEHTQQGAIGLIINRPMNLYIKDVLDQFSLKTNNNALASQPIMQGGPVESERGFILHDSDHDWDSTSKVGNSIYVTTSQDILTSMANGEGPKRILMLLGFSGWDAGQLEEEIRQNAWLTVPANSDLIFATPFEQRWQASAANIGVSISSLSPQAGHA